MISRADVRGRTMLYSLHIKNLALIDEQEIIFEDGLNILTGETGAGKSIIIGSVNLALGEQAKGSLIREGETYALITLTFSELSEETQEAIRAMDLPVEADGSVILERRIMETRSVAKVCGETVSLKQLRALAGVLLQIHGQNDHQSLLQRQEQARILDAYAHEALRVPFEKTERVYAAYEESVKRLKACEIDEATRKREEDLAAYELHEIQDAALTEGEDERLEEVFRRMMHAEKITEALQTAQVVTEGSAETESARDMVSRALKELRTVQEYDAEVASIVSALSDAESVLQDVAHAVSDALDHSAFDASEHAQVSERLNLINRLKEKYGGSIATVLAYADEKEKTLERLADLDAERERARAALEEARKELVRCCEELHALREEAGKRLTAQMRALLADLNFLDNGFEVRIEGDEARMSASGYDEVTFLISLNPGEPLKPLHEIASGGELSRIMLALKNVMADEEKTATMIFDEIDAGISGTTAWKVAEKLSALSKGRQVICITHLAQIAAMQDAHFFIEKEVEDHAGSVRTLTKVKRLEEEATLKELARLLGGVALPEGGATQQAYENAVQLRQEALRIKTEA